MIRDCRQLSSLIQEQIRQQTDIGVVGLSGGADSTLVAILCRLALGPEAVYGISMPYNQTDLRTFNARSTRLAETLGIHHLVRPVAGIADAINEQVHLHHPQELTALNRGNARSRARMCVLYGVAHTLSSLFPGRRTRVVGTGNLSEDFIGYDTKGGDALADFFPIGELFKSEVYQFLDYFKAEGLISEALIDRTPSAGLEENQTDEGDLGFSYAQMEKGIRFCLAHPDEITVNHPDPATAFVWKRHLAHRHKHQAPVVLHLRAHCD